MAYNFTNFFLIKILAWLVGNSPTNINFRQLITCCQVLLWRAPKMYTQCSFRDDFTYRWQVLLESAIGSITLIHLTAELNAGEAFSLNSNAWDWLWFNESMTTYLVFCLLPWHISPRFSELVVCFVHYNISSISKMSGVWQAPKLPCQAHFPLEFTPMCIFKETVWVFLIK